MASPPSDERYRVDVGAFVLDQAHEQFGELRSASGTPSEFDFVASALRSACIAFERFDELPEAAGPAVRVALILDRSFGAVSFTGVLLGERTVEIADFVVDLDYWTIVDDNPDA
jgi:hypothetical protein